MSLVTLSLFFITLVRAKLFFVGQDVDSIATYSKTVGSFDGVMAFTDIATLSGLTSNVDNGRGRQNAKELMDTYPSAALKLSVYIVGQLDAVNSGALDVNIDTLIDTLHGFNRKIYLEWGYDFDAPENAFNPDAYILAWKRVRSNLENRGLLGSIEMVWHSAAKWSGNFQGRLFTVWYPGDDALDLFGVNFYDQQKCYIQTLTMFMGFAIVHSMQVLVEAAPQGYNTAELTYSADGVTFETLTETDFWANYYTYFFNWWMDYSTSLEILAYVNMDFDNTTEWGPPYTNGYFGDSRVQNNDYIQRKWLGSISGL
jgi:hypothetical protein